MQVTRNILPTRNILLPQPHKFPQVGFCGCGKNPKIHPTNPTHPLGCGIVGVGLSVASGITCNILRVKIQTR